VKYIVSKAVKLSGVRDNFEFKGQVKLSRGFRKFYKSEADLSGMIPATVEPTQGHNIGIPGHYLRPNDTQILHDYEKVIESITIDPKHRLEKRNKELEGHTNQELAQLKKEMNELKQLVYPLGPVPRDKQRLLIYLKQLKAQYEEKEITDIDWSGSGITVEDEDDDNDK
jgi:hypothetical protein